MGGAHVACEWVSNVLTKILQRGRLAAYLEQSTRYIPYDQPIEEIGGYRYYSDAELGREYRQAMDELFGIYSHSLERVQGWAEERWPRAEGQPEGAWRSSVRAKALDLLRGLLPASTLSHVGMYASGQAYEGLLLRLAASPLPEARAFGELMLEELRLVMPSFVARVDRPDRGGDWIAHLRERREATERAVARLGLDRRGGDGAPAVELVHVDGTEDDLLVASLYESAGAAESEIRRRIAALDPIERAELIGELAGERRNRRHRPGRGWEAVRYRFEIVSDYGGFRDLQRHRMLTCQWQRLGPSSAPGCPTRSGRPARATTTSVPWRSRGASSSASRRQARRTRRRTRSASATGSATCSISTPARRCTFASCAPGARAIRPTALSRRRCMSESPPCIPPSRPRCATSTPRPSPVSSAS